MCHLLNIRIDSPRRVWLFVAAVTAFALLVSLSVTAIAQLINGVASASFTFMYVIAGVIPLSIVLPVTYVCAHITCKLTVTQQELLCLTRTDELTGLHNRRSFFEQGHTLINEAFQRQCKLGLLLLDADNFKSVNDTFGHIAGDEALRYLAQQIQRCTNADDVVARFGGDEFAVLRMGATCVEMAGLAAAIQETLRAAPFVYHDRTFPFSVSAGVADTEAANTFDALLSVTDVALYARKRTGLMTMQNGHIEDHHNSPLPLKENGTWR